MSEILNFEDAKSRKNPFGLMNLSDGQIKVINVILDVISEKTGTPRGMIELNHLIEDLITDKYDEMKISQEVYDEIIHRLNIPSIFSMPTERVMIAAVIPRIKDYINTLCPVMGENRIEIPKNK